MLELLIFALLTTVFFIGRYFVKTSSYVRIMWGAYVMIILTNALIFNYSLLSKNCEGNVNFGTVFLTTILPWVLIFGSIQAALIVFPSWKTPFSNTFGYLAAKLAGVNDALFSLLKSPVSGDNSLKKTLHNIYSNPALFINEITPANFSDFVRTSTFMFKPNAASSPEMSKLFDIIRMKDLVSEYIWSLLSGLLVSTVSYNSLVNSDCTNSVAEMKKRHDEYEKAVQQKMEEEKNAPPKRVYYIRD